MTSPGDNSDTGGSGGSGNRAGTSNGAGSTGSGSLAGGIGRAWCPGRFALLVDVGYLYASCGDLLGHGTDRRRLRVKAPELIASLIERAYAQLGGQLLRVYWFDGAKDRVPTVEHRLVGRQSNVKVRLGNVNGAGQQKGVDALIRNDLVELAKNRAVSDAILLAGDEDMLSAVEGAQSHGVRIHLWGVEPRFGTNQSERLVWEADTVTTLGASTLEPYVSGAATAPIPSRADLTAATSRPAGAGSAPGPVSGSVASAEPSTNARPSPASLASRRGPAGQTVGGPLAPVGPVRSPVTAARPSTPLGLSVYAIHEIGEHVANRWIVTRGRDNLADLLPGPLLPPIIDQELLVAAEAEIGSSLRPYEEARRAIRDGFWSRLYREFGLSVGTSG